MEIFRCAAESAASSAAPPIRVSMEMCALHSICSKFVSSNRLPTMADRRSTSPSMTWRKSRVA